MKGHYYKFSDFLKNRYGDKVWKIPVDAGFSCPNKDCDTGEGGCIFCRLDSFSNVESTRNISVRSQVEEKIRFAREKRGIHKYIVYFQASTNTFAPISTLRSLYYDSIAFDGVVGLSISTRPDCLPPAVVDLITELSEKLDVWVELGVQSSQNRTLQQINRGHTFEDFVQAVEKLAPLRVRLCAHLMFGLPGEGSDELHQTAERIADLPLQEVKLHPLLVLRDTELARWYERGEFAALTLDEYAAQVCDFIERMPPSMVIQRLSAEAPDEQLIAPRWCRNKTDVLLSINGEFRKRGSRQGSRYMGNSQR